MSKKVLIKTLKSSVSVSDYLNSIEPASARRDAKTLAKLFKQTTATKAKMWGGSIIGFGDYIYYRANGDEGVICATGFAARKSGPVLYIMKGYQNHEALMSQLGPHKLGKACLYLKNLDGINLQVLAQLITLGLEDLKATHVVRI
ncbi:MAG: DUF1801 domain-containing protein [Arenicella sp.]|nr:DUF1801 domain-containing protein [Arenicella sp.]